MGIIIPEYRKFPSGPGPIVPQVLENVYMSLRFEQPVINHNHDGTYTITGRCKVYQNPTDMYTVDVNGYTFTVTKDQLNAPLHEIIFTHLKTVYPGATDSI